MARLFKIHNAKSRHARKEREKAKHVKGVFFTDKMGANKFAIIFDF